MNEIVNGLKHKCDTCNLLNPTINMVTLYGDCRVQGRKIEVTCKNMNVCEMYKEFTETEKGE